MKPAFWRLTWYNPKTGQSGYVDHMQRAAARGDMIIFRAQGCTVTLTPVFKEN
jgi:hypothetical protein